MFVLYWEFAGTDVSTRSLSSDCWAVLVVTPIMRRAQSLESAQNIIFVDSTTSCDGNGSTGTVLLPSTNAGVVLMAVLVCSSQSREGYVTAFQLLCKALVQQNFGGPFPNSQALTQADSRYLGHLALGDQCPPAEFFGPFGSFQHYHPPLILALARHKQAPSLSRQWK
ncbi:hypothetical protein MTO96_027046 [Rhipicephalus appendiculatus]